MIKTDEKFEEILRFHGIKEESFSHFKELVLFRASLSGNFECPSCFKTKRNFEQRESYLSLDFKGAYKFHVIESGNSFSIEFCTGTKRT